MRLELKKRKRKETDKRDRKFEKHLKKQTTSIQYKQIKTVETGAET